MQIVLVISIHILKSSFSRVICKSSLSKIDHQILFKRPIHILNAAQSRWVFFFKKKRCNVIQTEFRQKKNVRYFLFIVHSIVLKSEHDNGQTSQNNLI